MHITKPESADALEWEQLLLVAQYLAGRDFHEGIKELHMHYSDKLPFLKDNHELYSILLDTTAKYRETYNMDITALRQRVVANHKGHRYVKLELLQKCHDKIVREQQQKDADKIKEENKMWQRIQFISYDWTKFTVVAELRGGSQKPIELSGSNLTAYFKNVSNCNDETQEKTENNDKITTKKRKVRRVGELRSKKLKNESKHPKL